MIDVIILFVVGVSVYLSFLTLKSNVIPYYKFRVRQIKPNRFIVERNAGYLLSSWKELSRTDAVCSYYSSLEEAENAARKLLESDREITDSVNRSREEEAYFRKHGIKKEIK